jgi:hypothetical protein
MRKWSLGLGLLIALTGVGTGANDTARARGPQDDGTKPALIRIAGEGFLNSHAFPR